MWTVQNQSGRLRIKKFTHLSLGAFLESRWCYIQVLPLSLASEKRPLTLPLTPNVTANKQNCFYLGKRIQREKVHFYPVRCSFMLCPFNQTGPPTAADTELRAPSASPAPQPVKYSKSLPDNSFNFMSAPFDIHPKL